MTSRAWMGGSVAAVVAVLSTIAARADILVRIDGMPLEGKLISQTATEVVFQLDRTTSPLTFDRKVVSRLVTADEHGALISDSSATTQPASHWDVPLEPPPPPLHARPSGPTYYIIPLHGEVGVTVLASALEKSLADAMARKADVIVLDIDSPGGLVEEARKIIEVIHNYNKQARIVALAGEDLSAAAILSLSCKEIYVKATGTIGAAVAYNPTNLTLPPKLEEKMQSAWRAVARNSAEEGGHEPLLAEAMIDNSVELHLETEAGKTVVKEGPGDRALCRKGKVLTLSSHEAVECGLAAALADDFAELGRMMGLAGWTECQGLGRPLADYLPKRAAAFKIELDKIHSQFEEHIHNATEIDPTQSTVTTIHLRPTGRNRLGAPAIPGRTIVVPASPQGWKTSALRCVLALQQAEADLRQAVSLCQAFGQNGQADEVSDALRRVGEIRAQVYDNRNSYVPGGGGQVVVTASAPAASPASPPAAATPNTVKTAILGGPGGGEFTTVSPTGGPVVGFRVTFGQWAGKQILRQVVPLYDRPAAHQAPDPAAVMARDGFVVAGVVVNYDKVSSVAFRVIFARYKDGLVDTASAYMTDWIGKPAGDAAQQLAGKGEIVVGTCGHQGMNLDAFGLVVIPADAALEAHRAAARSAASGPAAPPVGPLPLPDAASQAKALKVIQELYKPYPPRDRTGRGDLAVKMLDQGLHTSGDPAARYVLLRETRDMAAGAGDWGTAMSAVNALGASYPVDAVAMRTALLNQAATTQSAPAPAALIESALAAADTAIAADRYDDARRAATLAELWARNAKDNASVTGAESRLSTIRDAQKDFAKFSEATKTLKTSPADPGANLIAGKFKCFIKGDWKQGLALLAKGSDVGLKAVSIADLTLPTTPDGRFALGDNWWTLAEKNTDSAHSMRVRAVFWYQQAMPDLVAPLEKALAQKRMAAAGATDAELVSMGGVAISSAASGTPAALSATPTAVAPAGTGADNILKQLVLPATAQLVDGNVYLPSGVARTADNISVPFRADFVAKTDSTNIRLEYGRGLVIFNWEMGPTTLRYHDPVRGLGSLVSIPGKGSVPVNEFVKITWIVTEDGSQVLVNGEERARIRADYRNLSGPLGILPANGSHITIKSVIITPIR